MKTKTEKNQETIKYLIKKYNSRKVILVDHIDDEVAGSSRSVKFYTKDNILSVELQEDVYYLMRDQLNRYIKIIYRNGNLFTQTFKGSKSNFYGISKNEALKLMSGWTLSEGELVNLGIGWNVEK